MVDRHTVACKLSWQRKQGDAVDPPPSLIPLCNLHRVFFPLSLCFAGCISHNRARLAQCFPRRALQSKVASSVHRLALAVSNSRSDPDYVYFERSTSGFTSDAVARSTAAKLKLVSYYKVAVDSAIERNARYATFLIPRPNECLMCMPSGESSSRRG